MAINKILYPIDLTGKSEANKIISEPKVIGTDRYRAFSLNYGPFFSESVMIIDTTNNTRLKRGVDYECLYTYPDLIKLSGGLEVTGVLIITNKKVSTNLSVTYNIVGGHYATNVVAIDKAIADLKLDDRNAKWQNILDKPNVFQAAPHDHDFGDVYGMEYIISVLSSISSNIVVGNSQITDDLRELINQSVTALTGVINNHKVDYGNPHRISAAQIHCYTKTEIDAIVDEISKKFEALEPRISNIIKSINANASKITNLLSATSNNSQRIGTVEHTQSQLNLYISDVNTRCDEIQKDIDKINIEINLLKKKDSLIDDALVDINNKIKANKDSIDDNNIDINNLVAKDSQLTGLITQNSNAIKSLDVTASNLQRSINTNASNISKANTSHNGLVRRVDELESGIVDIRSDYIHLAKDVIIVTKFLTLNWGDTIWKYPVPLKEVMSLTIGQVLTYGGTIETMVTIREFTNTQATLFHCYVGDPKGWAGAGKAFVTLIGKK